MKDRMETQAKSGRRKKDVEESVEGRKEDRKRRREESEDVLEFRAEKNKSALARYGNAGKRKSM